MRNVLHNESDYKRKMHGRLVKEALEAIILVKLLEEPCHGYGMLKHISDQYETLLSPGQLYPVLHNLKKGQLLDSFSQHDRKIYFIKSHNDAVALVDSFLIQHRRFIDII